MIYDILIVGAGPIGIACGIEAKKNNLSHIVIEKGCLTNSIYNYPVNMTFFSTSQRLEVGDIPFVTINPKPRRAEALEYYRRIEEKFSLNTRLFEEVIGVKKEQNIFHIQTSKSNYLAKHVIIATGFYDIPVNLNVPGETLQKVKHYYNDPHYYAKQKVIVVGASNSSIDAALEIYRKGGDVTLVIRSHEISPRVKYWVKPDIENRIANAEIKVLYHANLKKITENDVIINTPEGEICIQNDFVLALTGYKPNFEFLAKIGIQVEKEAPCVPFHNPDTMETNIEDMYLAGVVCGGLNTHLWFIENSRIHAKLILAQIKKRLGS
ncbi:MAG: YpdA family putative bacillithiol disulfide reductase [Sphingobacterium sp.]